MPLYLFYTMVQKSQQLPKTQIKGVGVLPKDCAFNPINAMIRLSLGLVFFPVKILVLQNAEFRFAENKSSTRTTWLWN